MREDKREQFQEYATEMTAIAHQEDLAAAKYDAENPVRLPDEQVNDLLSRYDPRKMSKEEYNAFLGEMVEMGVIDRDDTRFLQGSGGYGAVQLFSPGALGGRSLDATAAPYFYHRCTFPKPFEESSGDILTWYGFESAYRTYDMAILIIRGKKNVPTGKCTAYCSRWTGKPKIPPKENRLPHRKVIRPAGWRGILNIDKQENAETGRRC